MKLITSASIVAMGLFLAAPAYADESTNNTHACTANQLNGGMKTIYTKGTSTKTPIAVAHCVNTWDVSEGGAVTGVNTQVPFTNGTTQLVIDGHPIVVYNQDHNGNPVAEVHGENGVAVGADARVGKWVPAHYECSEGTVSAGKCVDDNNTVIGDATSVPGTATNANDGTAIGARTVVEHDHSTALGADAKSTDDHQVTLGTEEDTISAPGVTSQKSKDRQEGPTELVTSDSQGRLATDGGETFNRISTNETNIGNLQANNTQQWDAIHANSDLLAAHGAKLDTHGKGIAIAMSLPDVWLGESKKFGVFGSVGGFDGETAVGFAAIGRLNQTWTLNAKFGADTSFDEIGWQVGAGAQW